MYCKRLDEIAKPLEQMLGDLGFEQGKRTHGEGSVRCSYQRNGLKLEYYLNVKVDDATRKDTGLYYFFVTELSLKVVFHDGHKKRAIYNYDGKSNQDAVGIMRTKANEVAAELAKIFPPEPEETGPVVDAAASQ